MQFLIRGLEGILHFMPFGRYFAVLLPMQMAL